MTVATPAYLQTKLYTARQDRQLMQDLGAIGVVQPGDLVVTYSGSGLVNNVAIGSVLLKGTNISTQGFYRVYNDASLGLTHDASDATNPRIDSIVARVYDNFEDGSGLNKGAIEIVKGTATAAATLDNRNGAAALPANSLLLADVLVDATVTTLTTAKIRDRRSVSRRGHVPVVGREPSAVNAVYGVTCIPASPLQLTSGVALNLGGASTKDYQVAYLSTIPTKITATKIRFNYVQGGTAATGTLYLAILDASGRLVISGTHTLTGALNTIQNAAVTITSTTFDAGQHYVYFGADATNTGTIAVPTAVSVAYHSGPAKNLAPLPNLAFGLDSTPSSSPTVLSAFTDLHAGLAFTNITADLQAPAVELTTA